MTDSGKAVENADLVVEAIIEDLKPKIELFQKLDKVGVFCNMLLTNLTS